MDSAAFKETDKKPQMIVFDLGIKKPENFHL